jgi:hypothetical protein
VPDPVGELIGYLCYENMQQILVVDLEHLRHQACTDCVRLTGIAVNFHSHRCLL